MSKCRRNACNGVPRNAGQPGLPAAEAALAALARGSAPGTGGRPGAVNAALFTRMVMAPRASRAASTSCAMSSRLVRSARIATARPPAASISATVSPMVPGNRSSHTCSVRPTTATAAPSAASANAIARPRPRLAPVTIAARPTSRRVIPSPRAGRWRWSDPPTRHPTFRLGAAASAASSLLQSVRLTGPGPLRDVLHPGPRPPAAASAPR